MQINLMIDTISYKLNNTILNNAVLKFWKRAI